ncbi:MAG: histidine kinase [Firmicutes bacterium]|nr:histidine kinase [Bacillota bacterium]
MNDNNNKDHIKLSLPNKPEFVSVARLTASSIASRIGFNIEDIEDIKVAIGEACTNAIQHSSLNESDSYEIEFILDIDKLIIYIRDEGNGKCKKDIKTPNVEELKESGLGLFIIKTLMDEVKCISCEDKGTEIRMVKRIEVGV